MLTDALQIGTLGLFSAMGGWVLYTDFRYQKVRNRMLGAGLAAVGAAYGLALLATLLASVGVPVLGGAWFTWSFYAALIVHAALASAAAVGLWQLKIWPAGDAKLFALFSLLLPLVDPTLPGFPSWLFMACMINVFMPPALWVVARAAAWGVRQAARLRDGAVRSDLLSAAAKTISGWRADPASFWVPAGQLALDLLFYAGLYLFIFLMRTFVPPAWQWLAPAIGLALMYGLGYVQKWAELRRAWLWPFVLASAVLLVYRTDPWTAVLVLGRAARFALTVGLVVRLAYRYLSELETREVPVDELRPYQVLAERTLEEFRKDIVFLGEHFSLAYKDGIQPGQLEEVKAWLKRREIETATVYNTAPFAPWIVFGFCLTLAIRRDIAMVMSPWDWGGTPPPP